MGIRDTIRSINGKSKSTAEKAAKISLKRRRPSRVSFVLPKQLQLGDPRRNSIEKIRQMSIDTADYFEREPLTVASNEHKHRHPRMSRSTSIGPLLLQDEYPEDSFNFSANYFFGDL